MCSLSDNLAAIKFDRLEARVGLKETHFGLSCCGLTCKREWRGSSACCESMSTPFLLRWADSTDTKPLTRAIDHKESTLSIWV